MTKINKYLLNLSGATKVFAARMELSRVPDRKDTETGSRDIAAARHGLTPTIVRTGTNEHEIVIRNEVRIGSNDVVLRRPHCRLLFLCYRTIPTHIQLQIL
jgi:hypothetical protein